MYTLNQTVFLWHCRNIHVPAAIVDDKDLVTLWLKHRINNPLKHKLWPDYVFLLTWGYVVNLFICQITSTLILNISVKCSQTMLLFFTKISCLILQYPFALTGFLLSIHVALHSLKKYVETVKRSLKSQFEIWILLTYCVRKFININFKGRIKSLLDVFMKRHPIREPLTGCFPWHQLTAN